MNNKTEIPYLATAEDVPALTALINRAFRVESKFKNGDRIDDDEVRKKMSSGSLYKLELDGRLAACVYVEVAKPGETSLAQGDDAGYIGLLAVDPSQQGRGIGKKMMDFAEAELKRRGCTRAQLRIIHLRTELLLFYSAHGYRETGVSPYPAPEKLSIPVHFIQMEKALR